MRVKSQLEQLKHSVLAFANRFIESVEHFTSGRQTSISSFLNHVLGYRQRHAKGKHREGPISQLISLSQLNLFFAESSSISLERDYFNLEKMIVASTLSGFVRKLLMRS